MIERNGKSKLKQKLSTPHSQDNGIKMDIVVVVECYLQYCYSQTEHHINMRSSETLSLTALTGIRVHSMIIKSQRTAKEYLNFRNVTGELNDITVFGYKFKNLKSGLV